MSHTESFPEEFRISLPGWPGGNMPRKSGYEITQAIKAIDEADPNEEDEFLQAVRAGLRFAMGYEGSLESFVAMYIAPL